ncbi:MAG TPA: hypothetical protein VFA27_07015 [Vicinamibacterales bacterium]|nr:hypothetical protein [Vicinamibacterales bacterium]
MPWDDELEQLASFVRTYFGEETLRMANTRAMAALRESDRSEETEESDRTIAAPSGDLYDVEAYLDAVRRELRRLVAPH